MHPPLSVQVMSTHSLSSESAGDHPPLPTESDTVAVPRHGAERCSEECEADSQCPWGQRCTRTSCGRVCVDTPGGEAQETQVLPQETWGVPAGWPAAGCSALQAEVERAPCLGAVGPAWTCAASMRSVPGATSAATTAAATSARGCLVVRTPMATAMGPAPGLTPGHAGCQLTCMKGTALSMIPAQHHCEASSCCCPIALLPADAFAGRGDLKRCGAGWSSHGAGQHGCNHGHWSLTPAVSLLPKSISSFSDAA